MQAMSNGSQPHPATGAGSNGERFDGGGKGPLVELVTGGKARAVLVTPDEPLPVATYAATELATHIAKATGVRLPVCRESDIPRDATHCVFVGSTEAARGAGIALDGLPPETAVLRSAPRRLFIAGLDGDGDPLSERLIDCGTLFGVYEFLDRFVGVRWLWPGELGTYTPRTDTLAVGHVDETVQPAFAQRRIRPGLFANDPHLGFSPGALERYAHLQQVFFRRHRMGAGDPRLPQAFGHSFEDWWKTYGHDHPEWFQLLETGKRGPARPERPELTAMCVSNASFRQAVVNRRQSRQAASGKPLPIGLGENDLRCFCVCDDCLAWDGPQPPESVRSISRSVRNSFIPRLASDRYAKFWLDVHHRASQIASDVLIGTFAYFNTFPAPATDIRLHPDIWISFVPWDNWGGFWYPRPEAEHAWVKEQWLGWLRTGASMVLRPNFLYDGYALPHLYTRQFAEEFRFYAKHGMKGTDFDSLTGQWAVHGPTLYLLHRLHVRPQSTVDELLAEYYGAFGAAAATVKAYFDYWEQYAQKNLDSRRVDEVIARRPFKGFPEMPQTTAAHEAQEARFNRPEVNRYRQYPLVAHELFPLDAFDPAGRLLDEAAQVAAGDEEAAARVAFLRKGFDHARLCVEVARLFGDPGASPAERTQAVRNLIAFRRSIEDECVANLVWPAYEERQSFAGRPGFEPFAEGEATA